MNFFSSIRKRIFAGLVMVSLIIVIFFSAAIKLSSDYLESVILHSNFNDELKAIETSRNENEIVLPRSTHTLGWLASNGDVPVEFIELYEGEYHDMNWKGQRYHVFVKRFSHHEHANDTLYIAMQIEAIERYEEQLNFILVLSALSLFILSISASYWLTSLISRPVTRLSELVSDLNATDSRLAQSVDDEDLLSVEEAINHFLERIQQYILREKTFSGIASHELRTPISTMRSSLETFLNNLDQSELNEKQMERLTRIRRAVIEMQYITESLLQLIKQESRIKSEKQSYPLLPLIQDIVEEHIQLKRSEAITIEVHINPEITITFPRDLIKIIIGNLLRNALENTMTGGVVIESVDRGISIRDSGEGLPDETLDWINRNSFTLELEKQVGIGLFLVAQLCQRLEISINASRNTQTDNGTTFNLNW